MIKTFQHKGLEDFFMRGTKAGIQPSHANRLKLQLGMLNTAKTAADMGLPGWKLHPLAGNMKGYWAVTVNGNWRMTFTFENGDAILVDYQDYH